MTAVVGVIVSVFAVSVAVPLIVYCIRRPQRRSAAQTAPVLHPTISSAIGPIVLHKAPNHEHSNIKSGGAPSPLKPQINSQTEFDSASTIVPAQTEWHPSSTTNVSLAAQAAAKGSSTWVGSAVQRQAVVTLSTALPSLSTRADALSRGLPALCPSYAGPLPQGLSRSPSHVGFVTARWAAAEWDAATASEAAHRAVHRTFEPWRPKPVFDEDADTIFRRNAME